MDGDVRETPSTGRSRFLLKPGSAAADDSGVNELERLMAELYDEGVVEEIIRPAAIVPEAAARLVLVELAMRHVDAGGMWEATPTTWHRYDRSRDPDDPTPMETRLVGTLQVAYGTPTRYDITIYRATVTRLGSDTGWTVETLCDEALSYGGLSLASCPRAALSPPPPRFRG
jgi:hypothetical protein